MVSIAQIRNDRALLRIRRIQAITLAWMSVEAAVSLSAAWIARSPALLAFGGDSAIELLSALVVLWEFSLPGRNRNTQTRAPRAAGALLFALAVYVTGLSLMNLVGHNESRPTYLGLAILIAAAAIMPWLSHEKRKLSQATGSAALKADAAQSGLCAYMPLIALVGLAANATFHISWMDPVAALAVTPLIVWEGKEAIRGKTCTCC